MRRSSNGNPFHAHDGKFTTPNNFEVISEQKDYNEQTKKRGEKAIFEADSPLGTVRFCASSLLHCQHKHPIMAQKKGQNAIKEALESPDCIYASTKTTSEGKKIPQWDKRVNFFKEVSISKKWRQIKVVAQKTDKGEWLVITAYPVKRVGGNIGKKLR